MVRYEVETKILPDENGNERVTYGIGAYRDSELVDRIPDVSNDYEAVSELVRMMNEGELDALHFTNVVEDFILQ